MLLPTYIDINNTKDRRLFTKLFAELLNKHSGGYSDIVFLCIGTDRATGDAFGPITGTGLERRSLPNVYGTLDAPIHALNLPYTSRLIYEKYEKPFIIAIDASLGTNGHIGCITLANEALRPGTGVSKQLDAVGNIAVTGIVNHWSQNSLSVLQSTRLSLVFKMSEMLADCIFNAIMQRKHLTNFKISRIIEV